MDIRRTDLSEPEVVALLELHTREMDEFSPPGTCHVLDLSGLQKPDIEVFAAWDSDKLLAIGALKKHDSFGEIKSMRAAPEARRTGAGRAMLEHLIARGRELGFGEIKLETGSGSLFEAALGLYEKRGFTPCSSFAGYEPGEFTRLMALDIR